MKHYTHRYLLNPVHPISVDLVGLGGNGSQVLSNLGRINAALIGLGHPGLQVRAWDADIVSESNLGRQLFSTADIGLNKAIVLIQRINRFFGLQWEAVPSNYNGQLKSNILITCVDKAKTRLSISKKLSWKNSDHPSNNLYYWLDMGNSLFTGQCIIGTGRQQFWKEQPNEKVVKRTLKTVIQKFPQIKKIKEINQGPSCSLAEALEKQDLFINSTLAQFGCNLIWKLIREGQLRYHGCYVNLETLTVNPIKI